VSGQGDIRGLTRHCRASPLSIMGRRAWQAGAAVPFGRFAGGQTESPADGRLQRLCGGRAAPPNKRMQLTKLRAAPELRAEVPPCAPAGRMDGGTASQLIRGVRWTVLEVHGTELRAWRYTGPHGVARRFGHTSALFGSRPPTDPAAAHGNSRQFSGKNRQLVRIPGKSG
jgi:hypothetical protein